MKKVQFMALVDAEERDRLDALRIVLGVSRAEVNRRALKDGGLDHQETLHQEKLDRLYAVAERAGQRYADYIQSVVTQRQHVPTLDELELAAGITRSNGSP